jgi:hypothetical protein
MTEMHNQTTPSNRRRRLHAAVVKRAAAALLAGGGLTVGGLAVTAGTASADYGPSAAYQIEISANTNHPSEGSFWMWTALTPASPGATYGTGDYQETDCIHQGGGHATDAAAHDSGTLDWSLDLSSDTLTLSNVSIIGGAETATVTVSVTTTTYGHTNGMTLVVTAPNPAPPGLPPYGVPLSFPSQNQIAP